MKRKQRQQPAPVSDESTQALVLRQEPLRALLDRVEAARPPLLTPDSTDERHNTALGCKTSEVALAILAQVVTIEQPNIPEDAPQEQIEKLMLAATAQIAELEPKNATEAMLFLRRAAVDSHPVAIDAYVLRATRLMRVFSEQLEAMAKLKGKSGQQRVVVEHVTVNEGGRAIVGAVAATKGLPGGSGTGDGRAVKKGDPSDHHE